MRTTKIVIAGNYGAGNLGDELILCGLIRSIHNAIGKDCKITVLSADPLTTAKSHHVNATKPFPAGIRSFFNSSKESEKVVAECDFFILGGGGLFLSVSFYANFIWAIQAHHAYKLGKKVIMCGQSIGKTKNPLLKYIVKKLFNKATLITVRDNTSQKNLKNLGVAKEINVVPDFAFQEIKSIPDVPAEWRAETFAPYALIALRQMSGLKKSFYEEVAKFIQYLRDEKKLTVKLVNFQTGHDSDEIIHKKILTHIKNHKNIEIVPDISNPSMLLPLFSEAKFALCMRLHSAITAIKNRTPFIAINYAGKVSSLLKDTGFGECSVNLENLTFEKLKAAFENSKPHSKNYAPIAQKELEKFANTTFRNVLTI